jgi:hypothetical protein
VPTALFLTVYLGAMATAARLLRGPARLAALPGALAVTVMLGFCGWALAVPAAVALAAAWRPRATARRERSSPPPGVRGALPGHRTRAPAHGIAVIPAISSGQVLRIPQWRPEPAQPDRTGLVIGRGQPGERTIDHGPLTPV